MKAPSMVRPAMTPTEEKIMHSPIDSEPAPIRLRFQPIAINTQLLSILRLHNRFSQLPLRATEPKLAAPELHSLK